MACSSRASCCDPPCLPPERGVRCCRPALEAMPGLGGYGRRCWRPRGWASYDEHAYCPRSQLTRRTGDSAQHEEPVVGGGARRAVSARPLSPASDGQPAPLTVPPPPHYRCRSRRAIDGDVGDRLSPAPARDSYGLAWRQRATEFELRIIHVSYIAKHQDRGGGFLSSPFHSPRPYKRLFLSSASSCSGL